VTRRPIPYLYVAMPSGFARDPNFTLEEKGLMMVLMEWARPTAGKYTVWPGVDTISSRCNESPRSIQRALSSMEQKGYITRMRRGGKSSVTVLVCMDRYRSDSVSGELPDLGMMEPPDIDLDVEPIEAPVVADDVIEEEIDIEPEPKFDSSMVVGQESPRDQLSACLPAGTTAISDRPKGRAPRSKGTYGVAKPKSESAKPSSTAVAVANVFTERMKKAYPSYIAPRPFVASHMMQCAEDMGKMYEMEHLVKYFDLLIGDWTAIHNDNSKWIKQKTPSLHYAFRLIEDLMPLALDGRGYTNTSHRVSGLEQKKSSDGLTWDDVK